MKEQEEVTNDSPIKTTQDEKKDETLVSIIFSLMTTDNASISSIICIPTQESPEKIQNDNADGKESSGNRSTEKLSRSKLLLYEAEPEDLELRQKLLESKMSRKRTEEDSKILFNRLQLLRNEEQKAWKKIEETKKKAQEIMKARQRNAEILRKKQEVINVIKIIFAEAKDKRGRRKRKNEINKAMKEKMKTQLELGRLQKLSSNQSQANKVRLERQYILFLYNI